MLNGDNKKQVLMSKFVMQKRENSKVKSWDDMKEKKNFETMTEK